MTNPKDLNTRRVHSPQRSQEQRMTADNREENPDFGHAVEARQHSAELHPEAGVISQRRSKGLRSISDPIASHNSQHTMSPDEHVGTASLTFEYAKENVQEEIVGEENSDGSITKMLHQCVDNTLACTIRLLKDIAYHQESPIDYDSLEEKARYYMYEEIVSEQVRQDHMLHERCNMYLQEHENNLPLSSTTKNWLPVIKEFVHITLKRFQKMEVDYLYEHTNGLEESAQSRALLSHRKAKVKKEFDQRQRISMNPITQGHEPVPPAYAPLGVLTAEQGKFYDDRASDAYDVVFGNQGSYQPFSGVVACVDDGNAYSNWDGKLHYQHEIEEHVTSEMQDVTDAAPIPPISVQLGIDGSVKWRDNSNKPVPNVKAPSQPGFPIELATRVNEAEVLRVPNISNEQFHTPVAQMIPPGATGQPSINVQPQLSESRLQSSFPPPPTAATSNQNLARPKNNDAFIPPSQRPYWSPPKRTSSERSDELTKLVKQVATNPTPNTSAPSDPASRSWATWQDFENCQGPPGSSLRYKQKALDTNARLPSMDDIRVKHNRQQSLGYGKNMGFNPYENNFQPGGSGNNMNLATGHDELQPEAFGNNMNLSTVRNGVQLGAFGNDMNFSSGGIRHQPDGFGGSMDLFMGMNPLQPDFRFDVPDLFPMEGMHFDPNFTFDESMFDDFSLISPFVPGQDPLDFSNFIYEPNQPHQPNMKLTTPKKASAFNRNEAPGKNRRHLITPEKALQKAATSPPINANLDSNTEMGIDSSPLTDPPASDDETDELTSPLDNRKSDLNIPKSRPNPPKITKRRIANPNPRPKAPPRPKVDYIRTKYPRVQKATITFATATYRKKGHLLLVDGIISATKKRRYIIEDFDPRGRVLVVHGSFPDAGLKNTLKLDLSLNAQLLSKDLGGKVVIECCKSEHQELYDEKHDNAGAGEGEGCGVELNGFYLTLLGSLR